MTIPPPACATASMCFASRRHFWRVTVQSDNPAYPDWPDRSLEEFDVIGRVIWAGRRLS